MRETNGQSGHGVSSSPNTTFFLLCTLIHKSSILRLNLLSSEGPAGEDCERSQNDDASEIMFIGPCIILIVE